MKEGRDYTDLLVDILAAIKNIDDFVKDIDFKMFVENKEKFYSTLYCLQIIGEAVKNLPQKVKEAHGEIPWNKIAGMRDKLIHGYFAVDAEKVWETVKGDLSPLKEIVTKILKER